MNKVFLARQEEYSLSLLEKQFDEIFTALGVYGEIKSGMTVVIKPNLIMNSKPEVAAITHPTVVEAVGKCVQKAGAKVLIAESSGGLYSPNVMKATFRGCGYTEMASRNGFELYTECKSREVSLPEAALCRTANIVEPFLNCDYLINIAKLKTHSMMAYSGAVKNLFGAVPGLQKPEIHCRFPEKEDFAQVIVDICDFLKPDLSIIDGIWAMEGDGPTGGERREAHALIASKSPYAADVVGTALIGIKPEEILTVKDANVRGLGGISLKDIELLGESVESLKQQFKRAKTSSTDFIDRLPKFMRPLAKKLATPYPRINKKRCVGCGKCAESCPQHTIPIKNGIAQIEYGKCIRCFCCHEMCPKRAIDIKRLGLFDL